jgi:excisionase family DNA binding protein
MNTPPVFVRPAVACELLGVHRSTLLRWEAEGKIHPRRLFGGHRRYLLADLRAVLASTGERAA